MNALIAILFTSLRLTAYILSVSFKGPIYLKYSGIVSTTKKEISARVEAPVQRRRLVVTALICVHLGLYDGPLIM